MSDMSTKRKVLIIFKTQSDDEFLFTVNTSSGKHPDTQVQIGHTKVNILIDPGASVNLLNYPIFQQIQKDDNCIKLQKTNARSLAYGTSTPLELAGEFQATIISASGTFKTAKFYVAQKKSKCILGYESSSSLGIIIPQHQHPQPGSTTS
jgi:hypothetical protein